MIWYVFVIEAIVFAALFTTILFVSFHGEKMYSPACIHNYPPDIQEEYFKTHERVDVSYKSKKVVLAKSCITGWLAYLLVLGKIMFRLPHREFYREHTITDRGSIYDYRVVGHRVKNPA